MTNSEVSLAQKSIAQQLLKSADQSKNKQKRERIRKKHEESKTEVLVQEMKIQPPVSSTTIFIKI